MLGTSSVFPEDETLKQEIIDEAYDLSYTMRHDCVKELRKRSFIFSKQVVVLSAG
jgi:hypothetical protein